MKHIIIAKCGECPYMSRAHGGLYCINLAHHDEMSYDTVHKDCPLATFLGQHDTEERDELVKLVNEYSQETTKLRIAIHKAKKLLAELVLNPYRYPWSVCVHCADGKQSFSCDDKVEVDFEQEALSHNSYCPYILTKRFLTGEEKC